ncbi:hypothetical protein H257_16690 [Aphanomyces astaci]|uniref:Uncharacterized protein n=1 Tax=Aphanomyces astaci TaxID=112090 RepID=W4FJI5_APHAT|nr:hypothetical protein H257_16690 [Aphanomyces astaci]ETV66999.1 hypothetical protein H257_16690 [Aphanomyces astaci]|eukprot:XP_009843516.1 hypothetical protein H257_16690 [Aphanomyces astaci]
MNDDEVTLELDFDHDALAKTPKCTPLWDDDGVAALFRLRYKFQLSARFYSKNNANKKTAYVMLAAELSVATEKEYSVAQVQDKSQEKKTNPSKSKSHSEALEAVFMVIKDGLIHLGSSLSAAPNPQPTPPTGATLDDVLQAIQSQTIAQLVAHLNAQKEK